MYDEDKFIPPPPLTRPSPTWSCGVTFAQAPSRVIHPDRGPTHDYKPFIVLYGLVSPSSAPFPFPLTHHSSRRICHIQNVQIPQSHRGGMAPPIARPHGTPTHASMIPLAQNSSQLERPALTRSISSRFAERRQRLASECQVSVSLEALVCLCKGGLVPGQWVPFHEW